MSKNSNQELIDYYIMMEKGNGRSMAITLTSEFFGVDEDYIADVTEHCEES